MSQLSEKAKQIADRLKSLVGIVSVWDEVKDKVKEEAPELFALLDALARDDYQAAARELLNWGSVVDAVAELLKRVDDILPEEKIIKVMERVGLQRDAPA